MTRRLRQSGMTLIEALIAIAIISLVSALVWSGFAQTMKNKERVEEDLDRYHVISAGLDRMQRELSMAYVSAQENPNAALNHYRTIFKVTDRSSGDRIDFTSFSHQRLYRDAHESDQNELSYFITSHPEDPGIRVLARREQARVDDDPTRGGRVEILIEDVSDFQLEFLDPLSGQWVRSWDTTQAAGQPNRLPAQVKIMVTMPHPRIRTREQTFATRARLPMQFALNHAIYNP